MAPSIFDALLVNIMFEALATCCGCTMDSVRTALFGLFAGVGLRRGGRSSTGMTLFESTGRSFRPLDPKEELMKSGSVRGGGNGEGS